MEETFPRGNRITPSSPWLLLSLTPATPTHTPAHTHARTHTHTCTQTHTYFLLPQSQFLGHPTVSYSGSVLVYLSFLRGLHRGSSVDTMASSGLFQF